MTTGVGNVPCKLCGEPTTFLGTQLCTRCWELNSRITADPEIARRILAGVDKSPGRYIDFVFSGPPQPDGTQFIETENEHGKSIRIGEWLERPGGFWALRVPNVLASESLAGLTCQEASIHSRETYIPCGAPAVAVVWHQRPKRAYLMCAPCAWHNVKNRGGRLLMATDPRPIP